MSGNQSLVFIFSPSRINFAFGELVQSLPATLLAGMIFGLLRVTAAVGILTNRMWGWVLGGLMAVITFSTLTFYLHLSVADGLLAGAALVLLLLGKFPGKRILVDE